MPSVLNGIRVVDLTEALAGPYCTMILGDLGADVIKVERPGGGDQSRKWGPPFIGTESAYFLAVNRNKRSITIDIGSDDGQHTMRHLLAQADVFVCNVRKVESLQKVGLDPETVRGYNPRLIFCSITGYGRKGPYAGRGGYDLVAQGEAGLMAATGDLNGEPMRWPVAIADMTTGVWSALGILAALYAREKTGQGQFIDQALLDGQLSWAQVMASDTFATGQRPPRLGNRHATIVPYQVFKARDKHVIIAVGTPALWDRFCEVLGFGAELRDDVRFASNPERLAHYPELIAILDRVSDRTRGRLLAGTIARRRNPLRPDQHPRRNAQRSADQTSRHDRRIGTSGGFTQDAGQSAASGRHTRHLSPQAAAVG